MTDLTDWDDDILSEDETDDDMIELVDIVDKGPGDEDKEQIIELTEIVEEENLDLNLEMPGEDSPEVEEDLELTDNESAGQGLETEATDGLVVLGEETASLQDLTINQEQLETALERVIEKKFADKIEKIMFEVLEKVIEREIAEIKDSLQKDLDHIGNA